MTIPCHWKRRLIAVTHGEKPQREVHYFFNNIGRDKGWMCKQREVIPHSTFLRYTDEIVTCAQCIHMFAYSNGSTIKIVRTV